jgi:hypothetical protein
MFLQFFLVC